MSALRPELTHVVAALLERSSNSSEVTLDEVGDAIGTLAVSQDDIEAIFQALEARGRTIASPEGGNGEERLRTVVATARVLVGELGRKPSVTEIATRSGMSDEAVRHALGLARIMQR